MNQKHIILILAIIITAVTLSACSGGAGTATSWPGLTVDDQFAYVAYQTQVYAVNLDNGLEKWRYPQEPNNNINFYADPSSSNDGQLIVGGYDGILYNLNAESGVENMGNWPFTQAKNRYIASALVAEGNIFAPAADQNLYALDLNGQLQWTFTAESESWAQPISDDNCECLYLTSMDHTVYAIDPQDGSQIWQSPSLGGSIVGKPAYGEDGVLYVGSFGAKLFALDAENGSIIWEIPTEGWIWSGPTLDNGILYFGDLEGYFYSVDANSGNQVWQLTPNQLDGQIVGSPLVIEDTIYITSEEGFLYKLDTSGEVIWSVQVGGKIYTSPKTSNGLILVAPIQTDERELLVAYNEDGVKQWSFIPAEN
jgi:outer membrane protein assembly factor BamB